MNLINVYGQLMPLCHSPSICSLERNPSKNGEFCASQDDRIDLQGYSCYSKQRHFEWNCQYYNSRIRLRFDRIILASSSGFYISRQHWPNLIKSLSEFYTPSIRVNLSSYTISISVLRAGPFDVASVIKHRCVFVMSISLLFLKMAFYGNKCELSTKENLLSLHGNSQLFHETNAFLFPSAIHYQNFHENYSYHL